MSACKFFDKNESEIIEEYSPLVVYQALKFRPNKLTGFDDYMQAGYIGGVDVFHLGISNSLTLNLTLLTI